MAYYLLFALFPLGVSYGAAADLVSMTIPNRLVLAMLVAFVLATLAAGIDIETFSFHLAAGAVVLAIGFACFAFGWIGGGDAKFAAVIALWLGLGHVLEFLVTSAVFGGVLTIAILTFRRRMLPAFALRQSWIFRLHDPAAGVPYGVALAAAALVVYPHTIWMRMAIV